MNDIGIGKEEKREGRSRSTLEEMMRKGSMMREDRGDTLEETGHSTRCCLEMKRMLAGGVACSSRGKG